MSRVIGYHPNGKVAFNSANLRGLRDYARKHSVAKVELGTSPGTSLDRVGLYRVTYSNGVTISSSFADPSVMFGFFLSWRACFSIDACRSVFNAGSSLGTYRIPFLLDIGRDGTYQNGPWKFRAYRDENHTPMVECVRS